MDGKVDSLLFNGANSRVLVRSGNGELIEADVVLTGGHADLKPGMTSRFHGRRQTMSFKA
jgi:spermidine/putrescine transport system ATP-binding protein